ncbi:MAG: hypothetical protein M4579_003091 [Chaenotheca gracillima]|nr:MAG: hypothetical protein M4579_003091 [Chaenotheca gracillima]
MSQMDLGPDHAHLRDDEYPPSPWTELNGLHTPQHHSPAQEYMSFIQASQSMPDDSSYSQMRPPTMAHQQALRPLVLPPWPSMLTSQSTFSSSMVSTAPVPAPAVTPAPFQSSHSSGPPRKTLTDADRRRMCTYHEENPTVKQTEIGAMFGVERSTVSKVLRQKEKYLLPDGSRSPVKRSKGRFPDIERALSNWARNTQKSGMPVSDSMIKEKARFFATTVGNSDSHVKINSSTWLEKFKMKNNIAGAKSHKKSIDAADSDSFFNGDASSASHTPNGISPTSPPGMTSPSPISSVQSHDSAKTESPDSYLDFARGFRLANSQSNTSLSSVFTDNAHSPFSGGPTSPTSPFFSPDPNCGPSPFIPQHAQLPPMSNNFSRPRSQTFPTLGIDPSYISPPTSSEPLTPKYMHQPTACPTGLESPLSEMPPPLNIGEAISQSSNQSDMSKSSGHPHASTARRHSDDPSAHVNSPSQEDARRALEVVMDFFQRQPSGYVDPQEYMTIGKLMEKLRVQQHHHHHQHSSHHGLTSNLQNISERDSLGPPAEMKMEHSLSAGL